MKNLNYSNSESYKQSVKQLKKANAISTTIQGACAVITKYWNSGYKDAFAPFGYNKPSDLRERLTKQPFAPVLYTPYKGKQVIAIFKEFKQLDKDPKKMIIDANGRETYPYKRDEKGNIITAWELRRVTRWTPSVILDILYQHQELTAIESTKKATTKKAPTKGRKATKKVA